MSKLPSEATQIRTLRRELREIDSARLHALQEAKEYRVRATKAEQECAEWKARFDLLLRQSQPVQAISPGYIQPRTPSSGDPLPALPTVTCKEPPCPTT